MCHICLLIRGVVGFRTLEVMAQEFEFLCLSTHGTAPRTSKQAGRRHDPAPFARLVP